ncbi:hypothetical protein [Amycolatopsis sp. DG1A-15b]|uniref:hypothetical protein n=1 Tax=Amycolatopsis sp. DG1A-15b TaxID=3052846 RepID=UPI00255BDC4D|nr:hypothetical protein [Amycolatopsis sp. DG1A-15b]WIX91366.1 hypothetical protein QRY02_13315 [Amycolatopsis sp. DG1A-15b]
MVNTVDPAEARHERLERWRGHRGVLAGAVAASVATLGSGALAGLGFGGFMEQFRTMAIDSVFADRGDGEPPYVVVWGTLGVLLCLVTATLAGALVRRYRGRSGGPVFPVVLALSGSTAGTWVSARDWLPPLAVGTAVDPVFHEDETWGFWAWVFYYADWWAPALLLGLTLLAAAHAVASGCRHAELARTRDRLLAHGCRVTADVIEVKLRLASDESGTRIVGSTVTVSYPDAAGVRRWATRRSRDTGLVIGPGGAEVLFDPARPGDEKSVFVALRRYPVPADWLPAGRA